jgi:predicted  nucleic acid-binding Zn-ribbon protein
MSTIAKLKVYGAAILAAFVIYSGWAAHQRAIGARDAMLKEAAKQYVELFNTKKKLDTTYLRDTLRLTRTRTRTDSVIMATTDTVMHVDTVKVLVEREREACSLALSTCESRVANAEERAANLAKQNTLLHRQTSAKQRNAFVLGALTGVAIAGAAAIAAQ